MRILVTGVSGYVGGLLAPAVAGAGHELVGLSRRPTPVPARGTLVRGDLATGEGLDEALDGVEVAYYLVHGYESAAVEGFADRDRRMATVFVEAARRAGVRRIVHLSVLDAPRPRDRSPHVRSRLEIDEIVRTATPESACLRASAVIGAGNWHFRTLTLMARRLPVVTLPAGGRLRVQPIDERDVVECLLAAATAPAVAGRSVDVAGEDVLTQEQLMHLVQRALGRPARTVGVPRAAQAAVGPLFARLGPADPALLREMFRTGFADSVAHDNHARRLGVTPRPIVDSVLRAVGRLGDAR